MATRSNIIVERADGKWARIYCHNDGYLSHNGKLIFKHYNTQDKVEKLVALGDLSYLGPKIGHKIDFDWASKAYDRLYKKEITEAEYKAIQKRHYAQCKAYGRDRGEKDVEASIADSLAAVWPEKDTWTEFTYVWRRDADGVGKWLVGDPDQGTQTLVDLSEALAGKKKVTPSIKVPFLGTIGRHKAVAP